MGADPDHFLPTKMGNLSPDVCKSWYQSQTDLRKCVEGTSDPAKNEPRARALPLSHAPSSLSSRGSLSGERKMGHRGPCDPDKAPGGGASVPRPSELCYIPSRQLGPPQWLRAMALQVGKSHHHGWLCMLEGEGWGHPAVHLLTTIELENIYVFSSDPRQRDCGGKVSGPPHPEQH